MSVNVNSPITLQRNTPQTRPVAERLWQLYSHDMSEFLPNEMDSEGLFPAMPDACWASDDCGHVQLYLFWAGEHPAGFAIVGRAPYATVYGNADYVLQEFFLARPYRGARLAQEIARQVLDLHSGKWELVITSRNLLALRFWKKVLGQLGKYETIEPPPERADATVLTFHT